MLKILRYLQAGHYWRRRTTLLPYLPEDISIELTNACNFRCSFCPQSDPRHFQTVSRSTLDPEQAGLLLTKLRKGGVRTDVIHWTLDGEPFLNKQIDAICAKAIAHGFKHFIFSTNGFFSTPERIAALPRAIGVTYQLCIDFCASPEFFERHRGTQGSWQRVRDNAAAILADRRLRHVQLAITDISSFAISDPRQLRENFEALQAQFQPSERLQMSTRVFHNVTGFVPGILEAKKARSRKLNLCPYPWTSLVVASNGDVVSCCRDLQHKTVLGNLFQSDLQAIWNGEPAQALRKALAADSPGTVAACRHCDLPYDNDKFAVRHLIRTAVTRLGILK